MSPLRMPQGLSEPQHVDTGEAVLRFELLEELDGGLARCERRLEAALAALAAGGEGAERSRRLDEAADAAWRLIVQHEACDVCDHRELIARYHIPAEVLGRVGAIRPRRDG
ncbi:DUF6665 family protein [Phenylobacterium sp.]|uniref:DUF6665 family protein n=1 Tax=Phenylobacterium sp. TaxID=1871053 RepID=UPI002FE06BF8